MRFIHLICCGLCRIHQVRGLHVGSTCHRRTWYPQVNKIILVAERTCLEHFFCLGQEVALMRLVGDARRRERMFACCAVASSP
ncbi:uncharacterized protein BJ212DRAFT_1363188 [Suillus subaureus]|uniref:Secreted protein n=1 Tax=Suillus subaureus TaxID=48587 RepID=A0A9P7E8D0_9AGAM|nr:uncharacterized protein BJ212DRAFT_1363188 [Suillus subaureus]KAG1814347.1 hypothetical protein BJ212DRAFT_1363188 [Suillus subaureus]